MEARSPSGAGPRLGVQTAPGGFPVLLGELGAGPVWPSLVTAKWVKPHPEQSGS